MPFLDAQGRLLGKMNLLDLSAGAVLGAGALVLYLFLARPAHLRHALAGEPPVEPVLVEVLPDRPYLLTLAKVGDAQGHRVTGHPLIELVAKETRSSEGLLPEGEAGSARVGVARFRVQAKRDSDGVLRLGDTLLKPGARFRFEPDGYSFLGTLLSVSREPGRPDPR